MFVERHPNASQSIEYLCSQYLPLRRQWPDNRVWDEVYSLLFFGSLGGIFAKHAGLKNKSLSVVISMIIKRCCKDFHRATFEPTILGFWLCNSPGLATIWLQLLAESGVNLREYCQHEQEIYNNSKLKPCRCNQANVQLGFNATENDFKPLIIIERDPLFAHLDPEYVCKGINQRAECLSEVDSALVGSDGRPIQSIPGAWEERLKPNSELMWVRDSWGRVRGFNSFADIDWDFKGLEIVDYASL